MDNIHGRLDLYWLPVLTVLRGSAICNQVSYLIFIHADHNLLQPDVVIMNSFLWCQTGTMLWILNGLRIHFVKPEILI